MAVDRHGVWCLSSWFPFYQQLLGQPPSPYPENGNNKTYLSNFLWKLKHFVNNKTLWEFPAPKTGCVHIDSTHQQTHECVDSLKSRRNLVIKLFFFSDTWFSLNALHHRQHLQPRLPTFSCSFKAKLKNYCFQEHSHDNLDGKKKPTLLSVTTKDLYIIIILLTLQIFIYLFNPLRLYIIKFIACCPTSH